MLSASFSEQQHAPTPGVWWVIFIAFWSYILRRSNVPQLLSQSKDSDDF